MYKQLIVIGVFMSGYVLAMELGDSPLTPTLTVVVADDEQPEKNRLSITIPDDAKSSQDGEQDNEIATPTATLKEIQRLLLLVGKSKLTRSHLSAVLIVENDVQWLKTYITRKK